MQMVGHHAEREAPPASPPNRARKEIEVSAPIGIVEEQRLPAVAARVHMVNRSLDVFAGSSGHDADSSSRRDFAPPKEGQTPFR
jgi:hypothetical protein